MREGDKLKRGVYREKFLFCLKFVYTKIGI